MNDQKPTFKRYGERGILISWKLGMDENLLRFILGAKKQILGSNIKSIVEIIHTYNSLLVLYDTPIKNIYGEIKRLKNYISTYSSSQKTKPTCFHIPVCYDPKFGLDLELVKTKNNLEIPEIISLHSEPIYTLYFMGFLPGFLYLGTLGEKLHIPRKERPRKRVEKGAVGIAGNQTGIYPKNGPGGWQIIGNCPLVFFDPKQNPPTLFSAGDKIKFHSITLEEHRSILEQVKRGEFSIKKEMHGR